MIRLTHRRTRSTFRPVSDTRGGRLGPALLARTEYRFGLVLVLLLATFVVMMVGSSSNWVRPVIVALTGVTLIASLFAADSAVALRRAAAVVSALAVVVAISAIGIDRGDGTVAFLAAGLVVGAPVAIARSAIRRRVIDVQTVMAALCVYVLLGMLWAFVYATIGGFADSPFFTEPGPATSADYLYFSYITQTTVGYGDLSAAGNLGRACAVLEALIGQLYLVTVVAVVVSRVRPRDGGQAPTADR